MKKTIYCSIFVLCIINLVNAQATTNGTIYSSLRKNQKNVQKTSTKDDNNKIISISPTAKKTLVTNRKIQEKLLESMQMPHLSTFDFEDNEKIEEWVSQNNSRHSDKVLSMPAMVKMQSLDSLMMQIWDEGTSQWVFVSRGDYKFDNMGNLTQFISYARSEDLSYWITFSKANWTYDAYGNMTSETDYAWDDITSQWINLFKYETNYDINGNITHFFGYYFSDSTLQWVAESKIEYIYDNNGNKVQDQGWTFNEYINQWVNRYKCENSFDSNHNLVQTTYSFWNTSINQWIARSIFDWTYDLNNNISQYMIRNLDTNTNLFLPFRKNEYTYDDNNNRLQDISYGWDIGTTQWFATEKLIWSYDVYGNMIQNTANIFDENTNQWNNDWKCDFDYDLNWNFSDLIVPVNDYISWWPAFSNNISNKPTGYTYRYWNTDSLNWITAYKFFYYYSDVINNLNTPSSNIAKIYPNPFSEYLTFTFSDNYTQINFDLYDIKGNKIMSKKIENNEILHPDCLEKGMYFFNIIANGKKQSGKLILE